VGNSVLSAESNLNCACRPAWTTRVGRPDLTPPRTAAR